MHQIHSPFSSSRKNFPSRKRKQRLVQKSATHSVALRYFGRQSKKWRCGLFRSWSQEGRRDRRFGHRTSNFWNRNGSDHSSLRLARLRDFAKRWYEREWSATSGHDSQRWPIHFSDFLIPGDSQQHRSIRRWCELSLPAPANQSILFGLSNPFGVLQIDESIRTFRNLHRVKFKT